MTNYSFIRYETLPAAENGTTFTQSNFIRKEPNTLIFEGVTGLTFIDCNLTNCIVPADASTISCLSIQKSFCSHLHPKFNLDECVENCNHVVDTDEVWIDGELVNIIYYYEDTIV